MIILKIFCLICSLYFTVSITLRTVMLHAEVKYGRKTDSPPITTLWVISWAIFTGTFIYLQFL